VWAHSGGLDGENHNYYDVNENRLYNIWLFFENAHAEITGGVENYRTTFYHETATRVFDMSTNPENFVIRDNVVKIRVDAVSDNYWRTRIPVSPSVTIENAIIVKFFMIDNIEVLQQYEFTLTDVTGALGTDDNGQIWLSRYYEDNKMYIHQDFWDADETLTIFLSYGNEYDILLRTDKHERAIPKITADTFTTKEIKVGIFELDKPELVWDWVGWRAWWTAEEYIKVSYLDNLNQTDNVVLTIYDNGGVAVYTETFLTNEWSVTWTSADENRSYVVKLEINHATLGFSATESIIVLGGEWAAPITDPLPGMSQLGTLPFAWGAAVAAFFTIVVLLTFGSRHAGLSVLLAGGMLVIIGGMGIWMMNYQIVTLVISIGVLLIFIKVRRG